MEGVRGVVSEKGISLSRNKPRGEARKGGSRAIKKGARRNVTVGEALKTRKAMEVNSEVTI